MGERPPDQRGWLSGHAGPEPPQLPGRALVSTGTGDGGALRPPCLLHLLRWGRGGGSAFLDSPVSLEDKPPSPPPGCPWARPRARPLGLLCVSWCTGFGRAGARKHVGEAVGPRKTLRVRPACPSAYATNFPFSLESSRRLLEGSLKKAQKLNSSLNST